MQENQEAQFENISEPITPAPEAKENKESMILDDHEHVVDLEAPEIKIAIREAKRDFNTFYKRHEYRFDLENPEFVEQVLEEAEKDGIFEKARKIRELIFGKNISLYGVCYLSNKCDQNCKYCPMGQAGYSVWEKEFSIGQYDKM